MKNLLSILSLLIVTALPAYAADDVALPAVGGYDVVSYFTEGKAVKGSGFHTTTYDGEDYLFSSKENLELFKAEPSRYLPQFGGWCAYGVAIGKKFYVDPTVFEVVDGKLYLNLDTSIQEKWAENKAEHISTAHKNWDEIASKKAADL